MFNGLDLMVFNGLDLMGLQLAPEIVEISGKWDLTLMVK